MKLELTEDLTDSANEIVSVAEAATQLEGDATYDATKLGRDLLACRRVAEDYCRRSFVNQQWTMTLDKFPSVNTENPYGAIFIPRGKIVSIDTFTYLNTGRVSTAMVADTDYRLKSVGDVAMLVPINSWPSVYDEPDSVTIVFTTGYGTTLPDARQNIKSAILLHMGDLYEVRQTLTNAPITENTAYQMLLRNEIIRFDFDINDR